jgi:hypothetical protein
LKWADEEKFLEEQLEILVKLRNHFGEDVIEIARRARLFVHQERMRELSKQNPPKRPAEVFGHSAYSVSAADPGILEYDVLEDSERRFAVKIKRCCYADFYRGHGYPEIGYALHCSLDLGEAKAFWPEIRFTRTKTLMQGDDHCNHCYKLPRPK